MIRLGFHGAGPMPVLETERGFHQVVFRIPLTGATKELLVPFIRKQERERKFIDEAMEAAWREEFR